MIIEYEFDQTLTSSR